MAVKLDILADNIPAARKVADIIARVEHGVIGASLCRSVGSDVTDRVVVCPRRSAGQDEGEQDEGCPFQMRCWCKFVLHDIKDLKFKDSRFKDWPVGGC